jgi:prepilin-type N-terminal cleavage/methylation domain-containing protein
MRHPATPTPMSGTWKCRSQAGLTLIEVLVSVIILGVVSTMLIAGWINLQKASAFALATNSASGTARDAIGRISSEIRHAQPTTLPTASPTPTAAPPLFVDAGPMKVDFYSVYNQPGAGDYGSAVDPEALRLTRIWLNTGTGSGSTPQKTLYWQRDTNANGVLDSGDRRMILATNVVNNSIPNLAVSPTKTYTAIFRYYYLTDAGAPAPWTDTVTGADMGRIRAVQIRVIVDGNLQRPPNPIDLTTTVRMRNSD